MYNYFCNACGHRFTHELPEYNEKGMLNDIPCPKCGCWDIYSDTPEGAAEAFKAFCAEEAKKIAWEENDN